MLEIKDNIILVLPSEIKEQTIINLREQGLFNIKFLTIDELYNKYYFSYNDRSLYYLMHKYNYKYDVALMYLKNLCYVNVTNNNDYNSPKLKKLNCLKKELQEQNLLEYNPLFKDYLKNKEIYVYGHNYLPKKYSNLLDELKTITTVKIIKTPEENNVPLGLYEFSNIEEEVTFIANSICTRLNTGLKPENIKIYFSNSEYLKTIQRIFKLFNLPLSPSGTTIYSTKIGSTFLENISKGREEALKIITETFNLENVSNLEVYNSIIKILNKHSYIEEIDKTFIELLQQEFQNTIVNKKVMTNSIEILTSLDNISQDSYVYLMDFNQGDIPKTYKDEDYLSDELKLKLNLETSSDLNKQELSKTLTNIRRLPNLIITYKRLGTSGEVYLSSLNDYLQLPIQKEMLTYQYSNLYNQLKLGEYLDTYLKYNEKDPSLDKLYSTYPDNNYSTYDNTFTGINSNNLKKYLHYELNLSYSTLDDFYHCSFRYYLNDILKINNFEETFMTIIGSLFHYILSICFKDTIDVSGEYDNFLNNLSYSFSPKEKYFLKKLKEELIFIIEGIKKQYEYNSLTNVYYEERIAIDKSLSEKAMTITFKGFIDKLMLNPDNTVGAIIDYKTGNPHSSLTNTIHGLDLQLPVYAYLTKNKFPNIKIVGFYLQKILSNKIKRDSKHTYEEIKLDNLKLQGYTNSNEDLIALFDSGYQDSKVVKSLKTTSKGLGTTKVLTDHEIEALVSLVDTKINEARDKIIEADFSINPKRIGTVNVGCNYCPFKDICYMSEKDIINLKEYKNLDFLQEN